MEELKDKLKNGTFKDMNPDDSIKLVDKAIIENEIESRKIIRRNRIIAMISLLLPITITSIIRYFFF